MEYIIYGLSANSLACLQNVFLRNIHSPRIGTSAKRLVRKLARPRIVVREMSCPRIVCPWIGMSMKRQVTGLPGREAVSCVTYQWRLYQHSKLAGSQTSTKIKVSHIILHWCLPGQAKSFTEFTEAISVLSLMAWVSTGFRCVTLTICMTYYFTVSDSSSIDTCFLNRSGYVYGEP